MISVSQAFDTALSGESLRPRWLVELANFKWTTHTSPITVGGETWQADGLILKMPAIKRERELKAHSITLELSALNPVFRQDLMNGPTNWVGSPVAIHLCLLANDNSVIGNEFITQYRGIFDQITLSGDRLSVTARSPFAKPSQTAGRLVTNQSQRDFSSGDRFMEYAHLKFENLQWGGEID